MAEPPDRGRRQISLIGVNCVHCLGKTKESLRPRQRQFMLLDLGEKQKNNPSAEPTLQGFAQLQQIPALLPCDERTLRVPKTRLFPLVHCQTTV